MLRQLSEIQEYLKERLPRDIPEWLRRAIEETLCFGAEHGYRLAGKEDIVPGQKVYLVTFQETDDDFRHKTSGNLNNGQITEPITTDDEGEFVHWVTGARFSLCHASVEDFLLLGEKAPSDFGALGPWIVLVRDRDDATIFEKGQKVGWKENGAAGELTIERYGQGPFTVESVTDIPRERKCDCDRTDGYDHLDGCPALTDCQVGHPQFVDVVTDQGPTRFSGAYFQLVPEVPAWQRLLDLYPDLVFDGEVAKNVCESWAFPASTLGWLHTGDKTLLVSFLETFRYDSTREEFLWHFIEAMTGEQNVQDKEY